MLHFYSPNKSYKMKYVTFILFHQFKMNSWTHHPDWYTFPSLITFDYLTNVPLVMNAYWQNYTTICYKSYCNENLFTSHSNLKIWIRANSWKKKKNVRRVASHFKIFRVYKILNIYCNHQTKCAFQYFRIHDSFEDFQRKNTTHFL